MKHRLIIVEGLPCSGKSTAARFLAEQCGMTFVDEGTGAHPADYENHAFLTKNEFLTLVDMIGSSDGIRLISAESEPTAGGIAVPLADWLEPEESDFLMKRKIYDALPWETEKPVMLQKWRDFAENAEVDYVFNCVLLQNPMCETMMRFTCLSSDMARLLAGTASPLAFLRRVPSFEKRSIHFWRSERHQPVGFPDGAAVREERERRRVFARLKIADCLQRDAAPIRYRLLRNVLGKSCRPQIFSEYFQHFISSLVYHNTSYKGV